MRYEGDINKAQQVDNQYAARRCSMITRLTRNSMTLVKVRWGAAIFDFYNILNSVLVNLFVFSTFQLNSMRFTTYSSTVFHL